MTFTDLPVDCLTALASFVSEPNVIVAVGSSKDARAALRRGVDIAERARFGLTVREAEDKIRNKWGRACPFLRSRHDAGVAVVEFASGYELAEDGILPTLLAYGAIPDLVTTYKVDGRELVAGTALHYVAGSGHKNSLKLARMLLDAGARVDVECAKDNTAGTTALSWALVEDVEEWNRQPAHWSLRWVLTKWRVARLLIERGADVMLAEDAFIEAQRLAVPFRKRLYTLRVTTGRTWKKIVSPRLGDLTAEDNKDAHELFSFLSEQLDAADKHTRNDLDRRKAALVVDAAAAANAARAAATSLWPDLRTDEWGDAWEYAMRYYSSLLS